MDSPYAPLIEAVAATLPAPTEHDLLTARRLAMQGPPAEAVGLDPYPMAGAPAASVAVRAGRPGAGDENSDRKGIVVTLFWSIVPYVTIAILVVGLWWRYRYDKFGWTTRSSQLYESRLLRIGSPLFHFGILVVIVGHVIGLVIPKAGRTRSVLSETAYHVQAVLLGTIAGVCTLAGVIILVYRRRTKGPVFMATTRNDKLMYLVLILAIVAGLATTMVGSGIVGEPYNYRETVSVWFRSIFILQPDGAAMAGRR